MNETIQTGKWTLCELITKNITIPDYQRPYVWDSERVKILLEDLSGYFETNQNKPDKYLLGSLILCNGKDKDGKDTLEVVDGQQRLVTLALILCVLNDSDSGEFLSKSEFAHSQSKVHIKENYDFIKSWFESKGDDEREKFKKFKANLKSKIEFIYVVALTLDDAFIFFDSANAKGKRLEGYDLIKAFHLRALEDYNDKSKDSKSSLTAYFAKEFERLATDSTNLKILFNDTLTPARQWLRHNSDKVAYQMDIYDEFCTDIPQRFKTSPLVAKDSLGILQNFVGGVDFFEYLSHFYKLYTQLQSIEFYQKLAELGWSGFIYNRHIYIISALIYLNKFPNGRVDYMLRLIARAVFALRCSEERIYIQTARNFAKEILPLIYYASFEQELEANLHNFIDNKLSSEKVEIGGGKKQYIDIMSSEYEKYNIQSHKKGE